MLAALIADHLRWLRGTPRHPAAARGTPRVGDIAGHQCRAVTTARRLRSAAPNPTASCVHVKNAHNSEHRVNTRQRAASRTRSANFEPMMPVPRHRLLPLPPRHPAPSHSGLLCGFARLCRQRGVVSMGSLSLAPPCGALRGRSSSSRPCPDSAGKASLEFLTRRPLTATPSGSQTVACGSATAARRPSWLSTASSYKYFLGQPLSPQPLNTLDRPPRWLSRGCLPPGHPLGHPVDPLGPPLGLPLTKRSLRSLPMWSSQPWGCPRSETAALAAQHRHAPEK